MASIDGIFTNSATGKPVDGASAKLWQGEAFATPPAKNEALPDVGFQVGVTVTTGASHGSDGAYRFNNVAVGNYWISVEHDGNIGWEAAEVGGPEQTDLADIAVNVHAAEVDPHEGYVRRDNGGKETVNVVAASTASLDLDLADGNWHDVTLTDNCTLTLTGATDGVGCSMVVLLRQDAGGGNSVTWPGSVVWPDDSPPAISSGAGDLTVVHLMSEDGGTTWIGSYPGGSVPIPWVIVPHDSGAGQVAQPLSSVNRCIFVPVTIDVTVELIGLLMEVVVSSGNISVGLMDESLNRLATSGAIACPAVGRQAVNYTAPVTCQPGRYWFAMSTDNTTATFTSINEAGFSAPLTKAMLTTGHPVPATGVIDNSFNRTPWLRGIITGGWDPGP